ncbi:MAG TPA: hypothetical protein VES60_02770 [Nakamurella sp.]|nr:hypothetical protein [Nakamurella sp.]
MTNPGSQQGGLYRPGQDWSTADANPADQAPAGAAHFPTSGYGYPGPTTQQPQYPGQYSQYPGYQNAGHPGYPPTAAPYAGYSPQGAPAAPKRPAALSAGAALSFLTASTLGVASAILVTAAAVGSAIQSSLNSTPFGSTFRGTSGAATRELTTVAIIAVVMLIVAFTLFMGGIEAALAHGTAIAITGNVIAALLTFIVVIQTTAVLLVWLVIPVVAVVLLALRPVRAYVVARSNVD